MAGRSKYKQVTVIMSKASANPSLVDIVCGPVDADVYELYETYRTEQPKERKFKFVDWLCRNHGFRVHDNIEVMSV